MGGDIPAAATGAAPTDDQLLAAVRSGDAAALDALLERYQPHLYRFGLRMCGNVADAGDVAQESLISMARSLRDFRGDSSVSSWLYTIARRFCIKKRRRSKFAPAQEESLDAADGQAAARLLDPALDPERTASNRELATAITRAIDALDPPQREVLVLRDVEGLSAAEVAKVVGISIEAVKSRLHRARAAVRKQLAPVLAPAPAVPARGAACVDIVKLFSQHLDGDIDPAVCAAMEAHLTGCDDCRGVCESLKRTLAMCRALPAPAVPGALAQSIKAAIRSVLDRA